MREVRVAGPEPIGQVALTLKPGLTALYGRNGAGKTRLLGSFNEALGRDRNGVLAVEASDPEALASRLQSAQATWRREYAVAPLDLASRNLLWNQPGRSKVESALGDLLAERWVCGGAALRNDDSCHDRPGREVVVDEVLRNCELVLTRGAADGWDLNLDVTLGIDTPALNALRNHLVSLWDTFWAAHAPTDSDSETEAEEELAEWAGLLNERDFFTVFGPVPTGAAGYMRIGEIGNSHFADLYKFQRSVESLRAPTPRIRLTGWFPDEALVNELLEPERLLGLLAEDDLLAAPDLDAATVTYIEGLRDHDVDRRLWESDVEGYFELELLPLVEESASGGVGPSVWLESQCAALCEETNRLLAEMLPEPPLLEVQVADPDAWFSGSGVRWTATDPSGARVGLGQLSTAQQRLVCLAASVVMLRGREDPLFGPSKGIRSRSDGSVGSVLLLDEPEAGLHALAEDRLVGALHDYALRHGIAIIAATHSRAFMRDPRVNLVEVYRDGQGTALTRPVEFPAAADPEAFGVHRADLLQLYQLVLLVEGRHDELVLKEMLGEQLARRRVLVVPLRGAANLKAVADLQILTDTLEVPVLVLLDGTRADLVDAFWERLQSLPPGTSQGDIDSLVHDVFGDSRSDEENQVASLARRLLEINQTGRFSVFGLEGLDILHYLPAERLVPGAASWEQLREAHADDRAARPAKAARQFKKWLVEERGADFGDDALAIAAAVAALPDEFQHLLARIDSIVDGWKR